MAASAPVIVVMNGIPSSTASLLIWAPSVAALFPVGRLTIKFTFPSLIIDSISGLFLSEILHITFESTSDVLRCDAVPFVAISLNPNFLSLLARPTNSTLSLLEIDRKTVPLVGIFLFPPFIALRYAVPKFGPWPIASPVDFISGPNTVSRPVIFNHEKVGTFTDAPLIGKISGKFLIFSPNIKSTAILANGYPVDLLTKGSVLLALGLASKR